MRLPVWLHETPSRDTLMPGPRNVALSLSRLLWNDDFMSDRRVWVEGALVLGQFGGHDWTLAVRDTSLECE